jgi:hypothetical protein
VGWGGTNWIHLAQVRDRWRGSVNAVMNHPIPQNVGTFLTSWGSVSFWRRTLLHGVNSSLHSGCGTHPKYTGIPSSREVA